MEMVERCIMDSYVGTTDEHFQVGQIWVEIEAWRPSVTRHAQPPLRVSHLLRKDVCAPELRRPGR